MNENEVRLRDVTDTQTLTDEIVELIQSGQVVGIEVMGAKSNLLAIQSMIEAKELLMTLGYEVEASPDFEELPVWDSRDSEKFTGILWTVKTMNNRV